MLQNSHSLAFASIRHPSPIRTPHTSHRRYNAIHTANTPAMDAMRAFAPQRWRTVQAHGTSVGLPSDADMGNSEVGHNALGSGQVRACAHAVVWDGGKGSKGGGGGCWGARVCERA